MWPAGQSTGDFARDTIKPGLLTHAIGHGREAAEYIDSYLAGDKLVAKHKPVMISQAYLSKKLFRPQNRSRFSVTDATQETNRCLSCGICRDCSMYLEACPGGVIRREDKEDGF